MISATVVVAGAASVPSGLDVGAEASAVVAVAPSSVAAVVSAAAVVSVLAPLGDLTESMFKRNLDVKDFGTIVKGHGGVLDRFDGFLFTLPGVYYLFLVLTPFAEFVPG